MPHATSSRANCVLLRRIKPKCIASEQPASATNPSSENDRGPLLFSYDIPTSKVVSCPINENEGLTSIPLNTPSIPRTENTPGHTSTSSQMQIITVGFDKPQRAKDCDDRHKLDLLSSTPSSRTSSNNKQQILPPPVQVRRSNRVNREEYIPLGPRHLEFEYHEAWKHLRYVTLRAVFDLGYDWKKAKIGRPVGRCTPPTVEEIIEMGLPRVLEARRRLDKADRRLDDALRRGFRWDNTPLPKYRIVEDADGNVVDVFMIEDPLAGEPIIVEGDSRRGKRKCDVLGDDGDVEVEARVKRRSGRSPV